jgi:hypothetical protein
MRKISAFTLVVILAICFLPAPVSAAPVLMGHQPPAGEQLVERVLTWLRQRLPEAPKPQKAPPVSRKSGGTVDPNG